MLVLSPKHVTYLESNKTNVGISLHYFIAEKRMIMNQVAQLHLHGFEDFSFFLRRIFPLYSLQFNFNGLLNAADARKSIKWIDFFILNLQTSY